MIVVDSAVKLACTQVTQGDEKPRSAAFISDNGKYGLQNWLQRLKSHGADEFFDVGTYFSYRDPKTEDSPEWHRVVFREMRDALQQAGYAPRNLWPTEFGTSPPGPETTRATHLLRAYAMLQAESARPGLPLEQCTWFVFTRRYHGWGITDTFPDFGLLPSGYAYRQWGNLCRRASYEGPVLPLTRPWDTAYIGSFQFADSLGRKFWIGWNLESFIRQGFRETLAVASRTGELDTFRTALCANPPHGTADADQRGYMTLELDSIPIIFVEQGEPVRPDLVVDSVKAMPGPPSLLQPANLYAFIKNTGNDSTKTGTPVTGYPNTVVRFYVNDSLLGQIDRSASIHVDEAVTIGPLVWNPTSTGWRLVKATVNGNQAYVELGMDDNSGFRRYFVPRYPTGVVDAVMPPGGKTDVPVVLFRLSSASWEKDSTGNTPADSARLVQYYYGMDTVALDSAFTAWFGFRSDTSWQFLFGEGKYRFEAEFKDGEENYSPRYPDSTDTVVVFDTTAAEGSIGINFGAGFASVPACTLACAVSDPVAGVHAMRIGNRCLSNVVANSGFEQQFGNWQFSGGAGGYDVPSGMALLAAAQSETAWVRQFIPEENIGEHVADSVRLTADVLVQVPGADSDAVGLLRFRYYYTPVDPQLNDTTWQEVGSAFFNGGVQALAGLDKVEAGFVLPSPAPDSGYQWRGGEVGARAWGAGTGTGLVWLDNLRLQPAGPSPGYSWWQDYDSLALWDLEGGSGWRSLWAAFQDSAGVESSVPLTDSIILDSDSPVADITSPLAGTYVNGAVSVIGLAFDEVIIPGDTFFESRRLHYRPCNAQTWLPCSPDSVSYVPVWPDPGGPFDPAGELGTWDTDSVPEGTCWLRLTVRDSAGNENSVETWVVVDRTQGGNGFCSGPEGGGTSLGSGSVWVGSSTGNMLHLSEDLDSLEAFTIADSSPAPSVAGVVRLADDTLLVADSRNHSVLRLAGAGRTGTRLLRSLSRPAGITTDPQGNVWLVDAGTGYILKAARNGTPILVRAGSGSAPTKLSQPQAITGKGSHVYVADEGNDRISVWDTSGTHVLNISGDFRSPQAVAVSDSGQLYVVDKTDGTIRGINYLGRRFRTIAATDSGWFRQLCLSQDGRHLFTLRPDSNQVIKLRIRSDDSVPRGGEQAGPGSLPREYVLFQPCPNPAARARLAIRYGLPQTARVTIRLYDITGREQRTLVAEEQKPGYHTAFWDRADNKGRACSQGIYVCRMEAENYQAQRKVVLVK